MVFPPPPVFHPLSLRKVPDCGPLPFNIVNQREAPLPFVSLSPSCALALSTGMDPMRTGGPFRPPLLGQCFLNFFFFPTLTPPPSVFPRTLLQIDIPIGLCMRSILWKITLLFSIPSTPFLGRTQASLPSFTRATGPGCCFFFFIFATSDAF